VVVLALAAVGLTGCGGTADGEAAVAPSVAPADVPFVATACGNRAAEIVSRLVAGDTEAAQQVTGTSSLEWRVANDLAPVIRQVRAEQGARNAVRQTVLRTRYGCAGLPY
jgi:ubiquinone biosynthesis protein UbiJ